MWEGSSSGFRPLVTLNRTTWRCVCRAGAASGSHAHPCLWDVTQADAIPGICKLGLLPPWGGGARRGPSSPAPTFTLGPTPQDLSWKEGIFESQLCLAAGTSPQLHRERGKLQSSAWSPGSLAAVPPRLESLGFWSGQLPPRSRLLYPDWPKRNTVLKGNKVLLAEQQVVGASKYRDRAGSWERRRQDTDIELSFEEWENLR